ncbi:MULTISPECIES: hypothetical protein [Pseudomonas]|uniref:Uncharacterized protein n=2 Tax=Pseudomonas TaxID=286 RepID=A0A2X2CHT9_PSELU|nr:MULTISPECIES: hypothetical protein [Pseudomonas]ENA29942.1 hypothetical protein HMPREF1487_08196 [Pseudomonas sp. HPB0071]MBA1247482.1 hypothetical protein [Pseudomonas zeshuii]MBF8640912.1 hypothetical protein [Pseudomonas zeshuii]MBH3437521.1 hypothetical protein [Pseudomonas luteola]MBW5414454.1 hypothetical protein [Pseudomonas sp. MAG002Y]
MMIIDITRSYARNVSAVARIQTIQAANDADAGSVDNTPLPPESPTSL